MGMGMGGTSTPCTGIWDQDWSDAQYYTLLTNGKGWVTDYKASPAVPTGTPEVISVKAGRRYRLRIIGGTASWGAKFNITGHGFDIIAVSGAASERTPAQGFVMTSGERVDVILEANQPIGNYWINVMTLLGYNSPAILHYEGAPDPLLDPSMKTPQLQVRIERDP